MSAQLNKEQLTEKAKDIVGTLDLDLPLLSGKYGSKLVPQNGAVNDYEAKKFYL